MKNNLFIKICWLLPLISGISIFIIWAISGNDKLMNAGIYTIYIGLSMLLMAIVFGIFKLKKLNLPQKMKNRKKIIRLLILNTLNVPIAIIIIFIVITMETIYSVQINNISKHNAENCIITGGGVNENIGTVKPGEKKKSRFYIKSDGTLILNYEKNKNKSKIIIDGYVTNSMGGDKTVTIK